MYGTIHVYGTVYVTVHDTVHIDGSMTWHWLMRCHDPENSYVLLMVTWQHISGRKISRTVYVSHRIIFNQIASLFTRVKPCYCSSTWSNRVLLTDDVAQSWASKLFLIRWPWFTPCIYKKGAPPHNLMSLNPFLGSILCNSFSILYFLCILINSHFTPSSIMSS